MAKLIRKQCYVAGLIERPDNHILIVLPAIPEGSRRLWRFPRGPVEARESAEAAMRRIAVDQLGVRVEIVVGQPPITAEIDGETVELRYFFCGIVEGEPKPGPYGELRWVSKAHLREYDFDDASIPVVDWLVER